jgi:hypothetical protein
MHILNFDFQMKYPIMKRMVAMISVLMLFSLLGTSRVQAQTEETQPDQNIPDGTPLMEPMEEQGEVTGRGVPGKQIQPKAGRPQVQLPPGGATLDMPKDPGSEGVRQKREKVTNRLKQKLAKTQKDQKVKVNIAFASETVDGVSPSSGEVHVLGGEGKEPVVKFILDGKPATAAEVENHGQARSKAAKERAKTIQEKNKARKEKLGKQYGWEKVPAFQEAQANGHDVVTLELTAAEIDRVAKTSGDDIIAIEDYVEPTTMLPSAMPDTGMNSAVATGHRGNGVGIYMSETGCPNAGFVTKYKKLDSSAPGNHNKNVVGILRGVAPDANIYCRGGYSLPTFWDLYFNPIHVASQSWGYINYGGYNSASSSWDNLAYNNRVAVFFASGNTGSTKTCPNASDWVASPSNGLNTIGVGAYDDANNSWASFSCYGPSGAKTEKPEISAPGVSITASGITMSGTSQATPHAAAFMAAMTGNDAASWMRTHPQIMKAQIMSGAMDPIVGGVPKVGVGGIDWISSYYNWYGWWWEGGNNSWFDANKQVIRYVYFNSAVAKVRAVVTWLNRGNYTLAHLGDSHPIGQDWDLAVYAPNGAYVAGSASWDNSYEMVNFDPQITGYYKFVVKRYANRDTASDVRGGLVVNW